MRILRKSMCVLLSIILILGTFTIIPISAAEEDAVVDEAVTESVLLRDKSVDLVGTGADKDLAATGHYNIAVGNTVITDGNYSDVLGDGKVSYNPNTMVLTLRNPAIYTTYKNDATYGAIHIQADGVTVKGSYHMSGAVSDYGLYVSEGNSVKLEGDFTFRGRRCGVIGNDLTVNSGTLKAFSTNKYDDSCAVYSDNFVINSGITSVEMQCASCAFEGDKLTLNGVRILDDNRYYPQSRAIVNADLNSFATRAVIKPWSGSYYDLWLGSRHVDSDNYADIYGDGTASYDPTNKILILNDPDIRGAYISDSGLSSNYKIYSGDSLTVKGSYKMTYDQLTLAGDSNPNDDEDDTLYLRTGVYSAGNLTLDGDFAFVAKKFPVAAENNLVISSGSVRAFGSDNLGIVALNGSLTVKSAVTKIDAEADVYPLAGKTALTIESGVHIATPHNNNVVKGSTFYVVIDTDCSSAAEHVVIESGTVEAYGLYLAQTEVTSQNCDDIFGDGKASYSPSTKTLILHDPTINGTIQNGSATYKIIASDDLTLKGSYHMSSAECNIGVRTIKGTLTFDGDFTFMGTNYAVYSDGNVTVKSGTLTAEGGGYAAVIALNGEFYVGNGITKVDMQGGTYSVLAKVLSFIGVQYTEPASPAIIKLLMGENGEDYAYTVGNSDGSAAQCTILEPITGESCGVWLGTKLVTTTNKDDIFKDGGSASYDPDTKTLTLNDPTIPGVLKNGSNTFKIFAYDALTVEGSYAMTDADTAIGLYSSDTLTLSGDFDFKSTNFAVYAENSINIDGGSLTVNGGKMGVISNGPVTVASAVTKLDATGGTYAILGDPMTIGEELIITEPTGGSIGKISGYQGVVNSSGSGVTHAVIERKQEPVPTEPPTQPPTTPAPTQPSTQPPAGTTYYDLWLGSTQVTDENKDDILGDGGKAKYDPATNTLTLDNPTITGSYTPPDYTDPYSFKIFAEWHSDLVIKGSYHMTEADVDRAVLLGGGNAVLDGDFTFMAKLIALEARGTMTFRNGSLKTIVTSDDSYACSVLCYGNIIIEDSMKRIEFEGGATAIEMYYDYTLSDKYEITTPAGGYFGKDPRGSSANFAFEADGNIATHVVIEKKKVSYNIWLGSTQVTDDNKDDILNDGGKAQFDPETNTLTLNDPVISGNHEGAAIYTKVSITVKGSYHMTSAQANYGILASQCYLTLSGSFTFYGTNYGIYAPQYFRIESGSVKAVGATAVYCGWQTYMRSGAERLEMITTGNTLYNGGMIYTEGDQQVTLPEGGSIKPRSYGSTYYTVYEADGTTAAKHAVIEKPKPIVLELEGEGTEDAPYLIKTAEDWDKFTAYVTIGGKTSGKFFKLMNDITVTTASSTNAFSGTFDGGGHTLTLDDISSAPFGSISGATIKNLQTDGSVSGGRHISALVGGVSGTDENLIENCAVAADIATDDTYCGGFIGHGGSSAKTTLKNCVFTGTFSKGSTIGTFWGWSDSGSTPVLENCLDLSATDHPIGRGAPSGTVTNCYYTNASKQTGGGRPWSSIGKRAYTVSGSDVVLTLNGAPGLKYNGTIYAGEGDTVSLTAPSKDQLYSASAGTLTQNGSSLTLTMPAANVTIAPSDDTYYTNYNSISANAGYDNETAENLFDSKLTTKWCGTTNNGTPVVTFRTGTNFIPKGYILATANDTGKNPGRNPISWTLEGSTDGTSWTTLTDASDNRTLEAVNFTPYAFSLTSPADTAYSYFRFTIKAINSGTTFQLSELQLIGTDTGEVPYTPTDPDQKYNLWLGSTQVTYANKDDILGDGGKAKFDPATNTLMLDNPTITDTYNHFDEKIFSDNLNLTIKGKWTDTAGNYDTAICAYRGSLTLAGDFDLKSTSWTVRSSYSLTIASGSLRAYSTGFNTVSVGSFTVDPSVTIVDLVTDDGNAAVFSSNSFSIDLPLQLTTPENGSVKYRDSAGLYTVYEADGETIAKHVVIEPLKIGDVDGNGEVEIIDATLIQRKLADMKVYTFDDDAADVDRDGEVTILDATYIQRYNAMMPIPYDIG